MHVLPVVYIGCHWQPISQTPWQPRRPAVSPSAQPFQQAATHTCTDYLTANFQKKPQLASCFLSSFLHLFQMKSMEKNQSRFITGTTLPIIAKFFVDVTYGRGSVVPWWRSDMLCTVAKSTMSITNNVKALIPKQGKSLIDTGIHY